MECKFCKNEMEVDTVPVRNPFGPIAQAVASFFSCPWCGALFDGELERWEGPDPDECDGPVIYFHVESKEDFTSCILP